MIVVTRQANGGQVRSWVNFRQMMKDFGYKINVARSDVYVLGNFFMKNVIYTPLLLLFVCCDSHKEIKQYYFDSLDLSRRIHSTYKQVEDQFPFRKWRLVKENELIEIEVYVGEGHSMPVMYDVETRSFTSILSREVELDSTEKQRFEKLKVLINSQEFFELISLFDSSKYIGLESDSSYLFLTLGSRGEIAHNPDLVTGIIFVKDSVFARLLAEESRLLSSEIDSGVFIYEAIF
jgi:hypothetical protein